MCAFYRLDTLLEEFDGTNIELGREYAFSRNILLWKV